MKQIRAIFQLFAQKLAAALRCSDICTLRNRHSEKMESLANERSEALTLVNNQLHKEIAERRKAESALRESEMRYRLLFENANESIFIAQDEHVVFPNGAYLKMTGWTDEQLRAIPFSEMIHPADRQMVLSRHKQRISGEPAPDTYVFRIFTADQTAKWVEINTVAITWEGRPATLNFLRDISSRKQLEQVIRQIRKIESVGTLAGGIAHQFNNALTSVIGNVDLARAQFPDSPELEKYFRVINKSVDNMVALVQQLLAYARGGKYLPDRCELPVLVEDVAQALFHTGEKQILIETDYGADTPDIAADAVQMRMVLQAILNNAVEAIGTSGTIRIATLSATISETDAAAFEGLPAGGYACLCIADDGAGMSEETRQRIFEPFYTTKFIGRGMGMAAVYGIIKNHNGYIYVDSAPGIGTMVSVFLPRFSSSEPA